MSIFSKPVAAADAANSAEFDDVSLYLFSELVGAPLQNVQNLLTGADQTAYQALLTSFYSAFADVESTSGGRISKAQAQALLEPFYDWVIFYSGANAGDVQSAVFAIYDRGTSQIFEDASHAAIAAAKEELLAAIVAGGGSAGVVGFDKRELQLCVNSFFGHLYADFELKEFVEMPFGTQQLADYNSTKAAIQSGMAAAAYANTGELYGYLTRDQFVAAIQPMKDFGISLNAEFAPEPNPYYNALVTRLALLEKSVFGIADQSTVWSSAMQTTRLLKAEIEKISGGPVPGEIVLLADNGTTPDGYERFTGREGVVAGGLVCENVAPGSYSSIKTYGWNPTPQYQGFVYSVVNASNLLSTRYNKDGSTTSFASASFSSTNPMTADTQGCNVDAANGFLYLAGGQYSGTYYTTVKRLNLGTLAWTTLASMPVARANPGVICANGNVYFVGGFGSGGWYQGIDKLDGTTLAMSTLAATLPVAGKYRSGPIAKLASGKWLLIGRDTSDTPGRSVIFDPATETLTDVDDCPAQYLAGNEYVPVPSADGVVLLVDADAGANPTYAVKFVEGAASGSQWVAVDAPQLVQTVSDGQGYYVKDNETRLWQFLSGFTRNLEWSLTTDYAAGKASYFKKL